MKGFGSTLKKLREERPGRRFRTTHKEVGVGKGKLGRTGLLLLGAVLVAAGLFFMAVPGPGLLIAMAGLFLISLASRRTARLLDRGELLLRKMADWGWRRWTEAPRGAKLLLVSSGTLLTATLGYALLRGIGFLQG